MNFLTELLAVSALSKANKKLNEKPEKLWVEDCKRKDRFTVQAEIIDKYPAGDEFYMVFETEDGKRLAMPIRADFYGEMQIGDTGELYYGVKDGRKAFGSWTED